MDATTPSFTFRVKPARADNSAMVAEVLNAVNASNGSDVLIVGTIADDAYVALSEQFGSDNGTVVLRYDRPVSAIKSATDYRAKQLKRKLAFSATELHNGSEWEIVAYKVRAR